MTAKFQSKTCTHCHEVLWLRSGTWDSWNTVADMFLPHQCDGVKAEHAAKAAQWSANVIPVWIETMSDWDERYGG